MSPPNSDDLREALQLRIAKNLDLDTHAARLEELREHFHHSITRLPFDEPCQNCNCVMYALGFRLQIPCSPVNGRFCADTAYLQYLIDQEHLAEVTRAADGLLAVYWDGDTIKHVGVVGADGRITSKWGIGLLCEHEELDVPSSYGNSIRYFTRIDPDDALDLLEAYRS